MFTPISGSRVEASRTMPEILPVVWENALAARIHAIPARRHSHFRSFCFMQDLLLQPGGFRKPIDEKGNLEN
jgi:hypothetical protein